MRTRPEPPQQSCSADPFDQTPGVNVSAFEAVAVSFRDETSWQNRFARSRFEGVASLPPSTTDTQRRRGTAQGPPCGPLSDVLDHALQDVPARMELHGNPRVDELNTRMF